MSKFVSALVAAALATSAAIPVAAPMLIATAATAAEAPAVQTVVGAQVNIVAQWNEAKSATGVYQAPAGYVIKSATPVVKSATRDSYNVVVSGDHREARLNVTVRGSGEWWNKERGWFDGALSIVIEPAA